MRQPVHRIGFTLIELLIVIAVIAALAAMSFPIWGKIRRDPEMNGTMALVQAVALAITSYERKDWEYLTVTGTVIDPNPRFCNLWDLNDDNILDANPGLDSLNWTPSTAHATWTNNTVTVSSNAPADLANRIQAMQANGTLSGSTYTGFYDMTNINVASRFVHKTTRQLRDVWGEPLRIAFAANTYGSVWFGVWSTGPDKISAPDAAVTDDITSWR